MEIYIPLCVIAFFAGFIQGLTGFGSVLLSLPLLAFFLEMKIAVPLLTLCGLVLTIILTFQLRSSWEWGKIYPLLVGTLPGIPIGVFMLKTLQAAPLYIFIGAVLISYSLYGLAFRGIIRELKKGWPYFFGFIAGCLGGSVAASGPPVIVYTFLQPWEKDKIKVTLQGYFLVSGFMTLGFFVYHDLVNTYVTKLFGVSLPFLVGGTLLGSYYYGKVAEDGYRKLMFITLAALGIMMLARGI